MLASQKLVLACASAARPIGVVEFGFRPGEIEHAKLRGEIGDGRIADAARMLQRQGLAEIGLQIERAPAFACEYARNLDPAPEVAQSVGITRKS